MSSDCASFDLETTPLLDGFNLIEASAGTGKTYTIAGLALRLILERRLQVGQILVTTFTELATAELRDRIRRRLRETLSALEEGTDIPEPAASAMKRASLTPETTFGLIEDAIRNFDEAPIFTIHGFCQRMLRDRAFESGTLFNAELVQDESVMLRDVADDFWRKHFYANSEIGVLAAMRMKLGPDALCKLISRMQSNPYARITPGATIEDVYGTIHEIETAWAAIQERWDQWEREIREIFCEARWAKDPYSIPQKMEAAIRVLADCLKHPTGSTDEANCIRLFSTTQIRNKTRSRKEVERPEHKLFELCETISGLEENLKVLASSVFVSWARKELTRRKYNRNVLSFDDLLSRLRDALVASGGKRLAEAIQGRYRAALLDEFQDTDPVQEEIFRRIYADSGAPVYLIGDPKQAIYGFRGADVYSYMGAAKRAAHRFTLGKNWRSTTPLVRAVNAIFQTRPNAFVEEGIAFRPVTAAGEPDNQPLTTGGVVWPPFQFWTVEEEKPWAKTNALKPLARITASEIARLLASDTKIGASPIRPGNIAILVRTGNQGREIQAALTALNIPSVIGSSANVFESPEAAELQRILAAIAEPQLGDLVRSAVTTDMLGFNANILEKALIEERPWEEILEKFSRFHELWKKFGFIRMLRDLMQQRGVRQRLLSLPDGERRLTNLLHLSELIHEASTARQLGISGTMKWLSTQMLQPDLARAEEFEMRLERDDEAVRILTIHKSKGLEFGIVFCPYLWTDRPFPKNDEIGVTAFHDDNELVFALGKPHVSLADKAEKESLAEDVRLAYVALTRAKHHCATVWGNVKSSATGLKHLLGENRTDVLFRNSAEIACAPLPSGDDAPRYAAADPNIALKGPRQFSGVIDRSWGITSFTGLSHGDLIEPMIPEFPNDETELEPPLPLAELTGIAAFPRGANPGNCLHEIFEALNFTNDAAIIPIVQSKLRAFNIHGHEEAVCAAIRRTLRLPLEPGSPDFTLSALPSTARLTELEFHFPINELSAGRLNALFSETRMMSFHTVSGFLKGYIDLAFEREGKFYIVDWKSNWLGPTAESYSPPAMKAEMQHKHYDLQLHLYTVAFHRYLITRLPGYSYDENFGGVFYVFVRGADPANPDLGIHRARPDRDQIEDLNALFSSGGLK